jgi:predicted flap endonuclease-1-like 5' DNA nuclease
VTQNRVEEMKTLLQQRDGQLLNSKKRVVELETLVGNQLEVTKNRFAEFQNRLQQRDDQLRASRKRVVELVAQMGKRDADSQNLNRQLEALRQQYTAVQQRQADLQSKMEGNSVNEEQFAALKLEYSAKTGSLQRKLKASEETIRTLRRERAGVLARLANYRTIAEPDATIISFKQAMEERKQVAYDQEYGGHTEEHATRGTVYTTEPESRDDLKRISGIAEVLEARLNDYGIYTFKQIMEWQPVAIEEFSRLLAFRDRIIRDDWKGQAKFFYQQKTQTSAA